MKISTVLAIGMLAVGSIAFVQTAMSAMNAAKNYQQVEKLRLLSQLRNEWTKGIIALSLERSVTQVMLTQDAAANARFAPLREEQRVKSYGHFTAFAKGLATIDDFANHEAIMAEVNASGATIATLRRRFEAQFEVDLAQRDQRDGLAAIAEFKAAIAGMEAEGNLLSVENSLTSLHAIQLQQLQRDAWIVREYAGRARTLYAIAALTQTPLSAADRATAEGYMLRADDAWHSIEQLIEHQGEDGTLPADVQKQITALRSKGLDKFLAMTAQMDQQMDEIDKASAQAASANPNAPPLALPLDVLPFDTFFEQSGAALNEATVLADVASQALSDYWQHRSTSQLQTLAFSLAALAVMLTAVFVTARSINRKVTLRLRKGLEELAALSAGQLDKKITREPKDLAEMSLLTDGLEELQIQLHRAAAAKAELAQSESAQQQVVERLSKGLNQLAAGNLSHRIDEKLDEKYQSLADNFNAATNALGDLVTRVIETSASILAGAQGINGATTELSQRTETQGVTLQNAAAALEQLTRNIISSQTDTNALDELALHANEKSVEMRGKMGQTVEAIEKIKTSSQQIEQIVGVIEDIAFQTNLLALNAGVEATRAGAEGSGFAVIASEVRGLAERSAQSAQDIKALIAASGIEVAKGVEYVAAAEVSVSDIVEQFSQISALISRIANAAAEQSQGLTKVNDGVSQLDLVTQTNVAMVEETTAECASLSAVAQDLSLLVARFQIAQIDSFDAPLDAQAPDAFAA